MTVSWNIRPEASWGVVAEEQTGAIEDDIVDLVESMLDQVQDWMRANHRWQNRTGDAEAGLYTDIERVARESVTLFMSHGPAIPYAVFLEFAHGGRFAILPDTADWFFPILYRGVSEIVRRHSS